MMLFTAALGGATIGFLIYNFNPASIFMGDTGSMFLGYVLAVGSIQTNQKSSTAVAILIPVVALGLPIADTLLAMARRAINRQPMFSADRAHIHHKLLDLGLSQKQAVLLLYGTSVLLGISALLLTVTSGFQSALILLAMGTAGFVAIRKLGYGHFKRTVAAQAEFDAGKRLARLAAATDQHKLWRELKAVADALSMTPLRLCIDYQDDGDPVTMQRTHGDWRDSEHPESRIEISAGTAMISLAYGRGHSVSAIELDFLKQALEEASVHLFGEPSGAKILVPDANNLARELAASKHPG
jgi:UDP-GlcNAc:undecaprenyl-phosphate GlcNAc-1-phosphate transferase